MFKGILLFLLLFLGACKGFQPDDLIVMSNGDVSTESPKVVEAGIAKEPYDLWEKIRRDLSFDIPDTQQDIALYKKRFVNNQHAVNRLSKSGQRYLFHTVKRAQELGVPVELALLPFVESEFDPYAQSVYGATGTVSYTHLTLPTNREV